MTADPPKRRDNLCACGCGRPLPGIPARRQKGVHDNAYIHEPFATRKCCEQWHHEQQQQETEPA